MQCNCCDGEPIKEICDGCETMAETVRTNSIDKVLLQRMAMVRRKLILEKYSLQKLSGLRFSLLRQVAEKKESSQ